MIDPRLRLCFETWKFSDHTVCNHCWQLEKHPRERCGDSQKHNAQSHYACGMCGSWEHVTKSCPSMSDPNAKCMLCQKGKHTARFCPLYLGTYTKSWITQPIPSPSAWKGIPISKQLLYVPHPLQPQQQQKPQQQAPPPPPHSELDSLKQMNAELTQLVNVTNDDPKQHTHDTHHPIHASQHIDTSITIHDDTTATATPRMHVTSSRAITAPSSLNSIQNLQPKPLLTQRNKVY